MSDPVADLDAQLTALRHRTFATEPEVKAALTIVAQAIEALRAAYVQAADEATLQRKRALVWAALSRADRLEAKAHTAASLAGLRAHAEDLEAAAKRAAAAHEAERAALKTPAPPAANGVEPLLPANNTRPGSHP